MQKHEKNYQAVANPIVQAMNKAPSANAKAFKDSFRDDEGKLKGANYELFRRYTHPNFDISKCQSWVMDKCIELLNMDSSEFQKNRISQKIMPFILNVGLQKNHKKQTQF
jgi:hypothetical protein